MIEACWQVVGWCCMAWAVFIVATYREPPEEVEAPLPCQAGAPVNNRPAIKRESSSC